MSKRDATHNKYDEVSSPSNFSSTAWAQSQNTIESANILYANDLQIYLQVPLDQLHEGLAIITFAAAQICSWAETNCLRLNASKTK